MGKIAEQGRTIADAMHAEQAPTTILDDIRAAEDSFAQALTDTGIDPAAFVANAVNYVTNDLMRVDTSTKIAECQPDTVIGALLNCAQMGLRPGPFNEAWIIPRKGKAEFHANYKGLRRLALEHPDVFRITAQTVREKDHFDVEEGTTNYLTFKPKKIPNAERGPVKYFFALAKMANGETPFIWWHTNDMALFRNQFASDSKFSPWRTNWGYLRMGVKTVLLRLLDELPRAKKLVDLAAIDGTVRTDLDPGKDGYLVSNREDDDLEPVDLDSLPEPDTESPPAVTGQ